MLKIKKGITLIELVVSISVSAVIFVGITGLLIFLNTSNNNLKNDTEIFYNANTLAHAIEDVLDQNNTYLLDLPTSKSIFEDDYQAKVDAVETSVPRLFTINRNGSLFHYYFYKQHFGYSTDATGLNFYNIYTSQTKIKLEFEVINKEENSYKLTYNYGESYRGYFTSTKYLVQGSSNVD